MPGLFVIAARALATPAAIEERLGVGAAWARAEALSESNRGVVLRLSLRGLALRFGLGQAWPDTGTLAGSLGGDTIVWYAIALVHQCLVLATFVIDGSIAAALYIHARDGARTLDPAEIAKVFD